jgi:hypothetical protein
MRMCSRNLRRDASSVRRLSAYMLPSGATAMVMPAMPYAVVTLPSVDAATALELKSKTTDADRRCGA